MPYGSLCRDITSYLECFAQETTGCNPVQLYPIENDLNLVAEKLLTESINCEITVPTVHGSPYEPLIQCLDDFLEDFSSGLASCYLPYADTEDMCKAATDFKLCVYRIPNLPAKTQVFEMVQMTSTLYSSFCEPSTEGGKNLMVNLSFFMEKKKAEVLW